MATKPIENQLPLGSTTFVDDDNQTMPGAEPSTPSVATPPIAGGGGGSTTTTTTTTVQGNPYGQFKGNNYEELEAFLKAQMDDYKPETKEEKEKREKKEKRRSFLANLADGLGTFHTTFAYARGDKPMDMVKMSPKLRELYEKQKAQRDKDKDRYVNYAIQLGKAKDADRDFNFRVTQAEQQQNNWQQQFDAGRKDRADDVAFRDKKFDSDNDHWQKGFDENKRQFDVTSKEHERHNRASEGLQAAGIAETRRHNKASEDGKYTEFYSGSGMIKIPNTRLNQHNISYVFSKTPAADRPMPSRNRSTGQTTPVSADQMMDWIGSNIDDPNVQSALRAIGGVTTTEDNTPPSRRNNNSNTPPSRR